MITSVSYALLSMVLFGIGVFLYKLGSPGFSTGLGAGMYIASHLIVLGTLALLEQTSFSKPNWKYLVVGGIFSGFAQVCFFLALKHGQTAIVVPIRNLSLLVTVLMGVFVLSESLSLTKGIGMVLGVLAIAMLSM